MSANGSVLAIIMTVIITIKFVGLRTGRGLVNVFIIFLHIHANTNQIIFIFVNKALSNYTGTNKSLELFSVDLGYSYSCKDETVFMGSGVSLDLTQYRVQAFDIKNKNFGPRKYRVMMLHYIKALHPS